MSIGLTEAEPLEPWNDIYTQPGNTLSQFHEKGGLSVALTQQAASSSAGLVVAGVGVALAVPAVRAPA